MSQIHLLDKLKSLKPNPVCPGKAVLIGQQHFLENAVGGEAEGQVTSFEQRFNAANECNPAMMQCSIAQWTCLEAGIM